MTSIVCREDIAATLRDERTCPDYSSLPPLAIADLLDQRSDAFAEDGAQRAGREFAFDAALSATDPVSGFDSR